MPGREMSTRLLFPFVVLAMAALPSPARLAADDARLPVPDDAAQEQGLALVHDIYKDDLAAAQQPREKAVLANKLLRDATATTGDPAGKYALLIEARRLAGDAGDVAQNMRVIDALADEYLVNRWELKANALAMLTKGASPPDRAKEIAQLAQTLVDGAIADDDYASASQLLQIGTFTAKRVKDSDLAKTLAARSKEITELRAAHELAKSALEKLEKEPTDADANLSAGRYYCVVKGNWETGLPMLALGNDERLGKLAATELAAPDDEQEQLLLADGWWDLAETLAGSEQAAVRAHASRYYEQALPRLSGLAKAKATKRIELARQEIVNGQSPGRSASAQFPRGGAPEITNSIGVQLRLISQGDFVMGSPPSERGRDSHETQHRVRLTKPFYLGKYELTQQQYERVTGSNPSQSSAADNPVDNVTWLDAVEFCRRLSAMPAEKAAKRTYRLPTEAEWEYACRAGSETAYSFGNDEALLGDYAWHNSNGRAVHPVGQKPPNAWGLYDMHGNVFEWCLDAYGGDYPRVDTIDPLGATNAQYRIYRGGSGGSPPRGCRSAHRERQSPDFRDAFLGFRIACDVRGVRRGPAPPPTDTTGVGGAANAEIEPRRPSTSQVPPKYKPIKTIALDDARTLNVMDLLSPPTDKLLESLFPKPVAVQQSATGNVSASFSYRRSKIHGGLALFADGGRVEVLGQYADGERNGIFRTTNDKGERQYLAEYKKGKKINLAFLFEKDLPAYLEEWEKGERARQWLILTENDQAIGRLATTLDDTGRLRLEELVKQFQAVEQLIGDREMAVKKWWPEEYKRMQQELIAAKSVEARRRIMDRQKDRESEENLKFQQMLRGGLYRATGR